MSYNNKTWTNPIQLNATELNRIEAGINYAHNNLSILNDSIKTNDINLNRLQQSVDSLLSTTPDAINTLSQLLNTLTSNTVNTESLITITNKALTKEKQTFTSPELKIIYDNLKLHSLNTVEDILVDNKSILVDKKANIIMPIVDQTLNEHSTNAISNKAITQALKTLNIDVDIDVPTHLNQLYSDSNHRVITDAQITLWDSYPSFYLTKEEIYNWAKQPTKPSYSYSELTGTKPTYTLDDVLDGEYRSIPEVPTKTSDITNDGDGTSIFATENYVNTNGGKIDTIEINGEIQEITLKKVSFDIPTTTEELQNNSGFITESVNSLTNYYKKSETYSQNDINNLISGITTVSFSKLATLPASGSSNIIYLINKTGASQDIYDEYIWVDNNWEKIGTTQIDLSGYATTTVTNNISSALSELTSVVITNTNNITSNTTKINTVLEVRRYG